MCRGNACVVGITYSFQIPSFLKIHINLINDEIDNNDIPDLQRIAHHISFGLSM